MKNIIAFCCLLMLSFYTTQIKSNLPQTSATQIALAQKPINTNVKDEGFNKEKCTFNGIPLHGRVKIVTAFGDIKVQIVEAFSDINVKVVETFPNECGEWQFVDAFPDFTIQIVEAFGDIKIKYVEAFPGTN